MKIVQRILFAAGSLALASSMAWAEPASEASVETLLAITKSEAMVDAVYAQVEGMMKQGMQQTVGDKPLTEEQQRVLDTLPARFAAVLRQEFSWALLKPQYVQLYRDSFDQEEVDGLIAFYRSRAGQAFVTKMPLLMQKSIALSQQQMKILLPKIKAAMDEALAEAKITR
jgi:uncharacterized protein